MFTAAFAVIILAGFSVLAFWSSYAPFFMITGGLAMMLGLKIYDVYNNDTGLTMGLCLIGYAFIAMAFALYYMFWRGEQRE